MATVALAAIGKVFAGFGLSGAAGATGAAGAAGTAAAGSGALGALQGFSTVLKVLGGLGAASAAARQDNQLADQAELESGQAQLQGEQQKTKMSRELARVLGDNQVAFAAAGIDLTQGQAASNAAAAKQRAAAEISIDQQDTDFRRAMLRMRATNLRDRARSTRGMGLLSAVGDGVNYGMSLAARG